MKFKMIEPKARYKPFSQIGVGEFFDYMGLPYLKISPPTAYSYEADCLADIELETVVRSIVVDTVEGSGAYVVFDLLNVGEFFQHEDYGICYKVGPGSFFCSGGLVSYAAEKMMIVHSILDPVVTFRRL